MTKGRLLAVAIATAVVVLLVPAASRNISFSPVVNASNTNQPPHAPTGARAASGSTKTGTGTLFVTHATNASTDAVTRYDATCTSTDGGTTKHGAHNGPSAASITVAGVTTKKSYRCSVTATNAHGTSPASSKSNAVIVGAPGQPHAPSITRIGPEHLKVSFAAPADNGSAITSFHAVCKSSNGGVARGNTGAASPVGVLHLTSGKTYTCTIQATNRRGAGPESPASNSVNARNVLDGTQVCSPRRTTAPARPRSACATGIAVYRAGTWLVRGQTSTFFGRSGDIPVPGAYDGGRIEQAVFRPSAGAWYIDGHAPVYFGLPGDIPVPGDYNGDGKTDIAVFRPSDGGWYILLNGVAQPPVFLGLPGDIPAPGDYNGDGKTDIALFRPSTGAWRIDINGTELPPVYFGLPGDIPVPGDYNGDGKTDIAVFRPQYGEWLIQNQPTVFLGLPGDIPVPGDYTGDGTTDPAIFRPAVSGWYIKGHATVFYGLPTDVPTPLQPNRVP